MNNGNSILLGSVFALSSLLAGCAPTSSAITPRDRTLPANSKDGNTRPIPVRVFNPQPAPNLAGSTLLIPAALSVENIAIVLAERDGQVISLSGREGARVKKGEVLAQLNDDEQPSQLQQAELEVRRLQVEEQQYEALVKLNRSELERELALAKEGVSSLSDVERARYKLEQATHEYEKTRLATDSARARVQAVKIEAGKRVVRAPISGIITHRYLTLGTNVAKNEKLFEVAMLSPLEVKFHLPQTEKNRLSTGQLIELSLTNEDRTIARARIRRVDPVADATSNTFGYLADIVSGSALVPGLAVNIRLARAAGGIAFWLPRAAFPSTMTLRVGAACPLFVVEGNKAISRMVMVSALEGDQVAVVSGLEKNDRVILIPPAELKGGDVVDPDPG